MLLKRREDTSRLRRSFKEVENLKKPYQMSSREITKLVKHGQLPAVEVISSVLERITQVEDRIHAFISIMKEEALKRAQEIDKKLKEGKKVGRLAGVPIAIKDNMCTAGSRTTCGSHILENYIPPYNATIVDKLGANRATSDIGDSSEKFRDGYFSGDLIVGGNVDNVDVSAHVHSGGADDAPNVPWANVSNTPFRLYKHWVHEGGIATPLIAYWPKGISARGELRHQQGQLTDIMATCIDVGGVDYPKEYNGHKIHQPEGRSLVPVFAGAKVDRPEGIFWEHEGNRAVRRGDWKLVSKYPGKWELYNLKEDRTEMKNLIDKKPQIAAELKKMYSDWAKRCNVVPWKELTAKKK